MPPSPGPPDMTRSAAASAGASQQMDTSFEWAPVPLAQVRLVDRRVLECNRAWRELLSERGLGSAVRALEECFGSWTRARLREGMRALIERDQIVVEDLPLLGVVSPEAVFRLRARRRGDRIAMVSLEPSREQGPGPAPGGSIWSTIVTSAAPHALVTDLSGRLLAVGAALAAHLGWSDPLPIGRPVAMALPRSTAQAWERARRALLTQSAPGTWREEISFPAPSADDSPWTGRISLLELLGQRILMLRAQTGLIPDAQAPTPAKALPAPRGEDALERFSEQAPVGFFLADSRGRVVWCNSLFRRLIGLADRELPCDLIEAVHEEQREEFAHTYLRSLGRPATFTLEARFGATGERGRTLVMRASPRGEDGEGWFGTVSDVTRSRETLQRLERQKTLFETVVQAMSDGVIACDEAWRIRLSNPAARKVLGLPPVEGDLERWVCPRLAAPPATVPWSDRTDTPRRGTLELFGPEGNAILHWTRSELPDNQQAFRHLIVIRDVTKERASIVALERSNEELSDFARSISHDLKSPIRAICGLSDALLEDSGGKLPESERRCLEHLRQASLQLRRNIDDLLDHAHLGAEPMTTSEIPLERVFRQVREGLIPRILETGAQLEEPESYPSVRGHETLLVRVFHNLLDNALKFVPPDEAPQVRITCHLEGQDAVIRVSDRGIGIPVEQRERVWNPFRRLHSKQDYEGNGMGLAIVRKAVDLMRGSVEVTSVSGKGTSFIVRLPAQGGPSQIGGLDRGLKSWPDTTPQRESGSEEEEVTT